MNGFEDLRGKVAVLTGGAGVIGQSLAMGLARAGIKVALADLNLEAAQKAAAEVAQATGGTVIGVACNVLDRPSLEQTKATVVKELGPIDILINGAGGNNPTATTAVEQMTEADTDLTKTFYGLDENGFDKVFALNFKGTLLPTMVLTADMVGQGGVVLNISSMNSYRPLTKIPAYSAAKASVNNFTQWLAVHLARVNIRVNAVAPGFFLTNQNRFLMIDEKSGALSDRAKKILANTPMNRFGEVDELQGTVLYLLSDISRFVTGVIIPVDGGYSAFGGV